MSVAFLLKNRKFQVPQYSYLANIGPNILEATYIQDFFIQKGRE